MHAVEVGAAAAVVDAAVVVVEALVGAAVTRGPRGAAVAADIRVLRVAVAAIPGHPVEAAATRDRLAAGEQVLALPAEAIFRDRRAVVVFPGLRRVGAVLPGPRPAGAVHRGLRPAVARRVRPAAGGRLHARRNSPLAVAVAYLPMPDNVQLSCHPAAPDAPEVITVREATTVPESMEVSHHNCRPGIDLLSSPAVVSAPAAAKLASRLDRVREAGLRIVRPPATAPRSVQAKEMWGTFSAPLQAVPWEEHWPGAWVIGLRSYRQNARASVIVPVLESVREISNARRGPNNARTGPTVHRTATSNGSSG